MDWKWPAIWIVTAEYLAALLIGSVVGYHYTIPLLEITKVSVGIIIIGFGCFALYRIALYARRGETSPSRALLGDLVNAYGFPITVVLIMAQGAVLGWLKATMPFAVGFWADPLLADIDAAIFGIDPWRLLHRLPGWCATVIDTIYMSWLAGVTITSTLLYFLPVSEARSRSLIAYFVLLGSTSLLQYLLPSAGPVFYEAVGHGARFSDLPVQPWVERTSSFLWDAYQNSTGKAGGGISAMPSLHVGGACWIALVMRAYLPRLQLIGWAYLAVIAVGSVYLGWHYAIDSFAGIAIAAFAWAISNKLGRTRFNPFPTLQWRQDQSRVT